MNQITSLQQRPYLLVNKIQHYEWGARGQDAFIPRFLGITAQSDLPYAELWIGTHAKAPSEVVLDGHCASLPDVISEYPLQVLGARVYEKFSSALPFLLKILSIAEPLSIQVHPNKEQAQALHARDAEHYPDNNHKPELAIALDSLTALVGFKSPCGILRTLKRTPELVDFIGQYTLQRLRESRKQSSLEQRNLMQLLYSTLMERSDARERTLVRCIGQLEKRLRELTDVLTDEEQIFLDRRERSTEADAGLLSIFLLNSIHLRNGQGIFLDPGTLHAYVSGNIVECMANSDNVVRAGLTQKFMDFETIVDILHYESRYVSILEADSAQDYVVYHTPADEFRVSRWRLGQNQGVIEEIPKGPEILLITRGEVVISWRINSDRLKTHFRQGQSILIPAFMGEYKITPLDSVEVFRVEVP